ncbi:MAG: adenylate cyclase [Ignavibacteriales bacterium CG_4_9_14_3_um_filter_34_10]|nr:MAG: adenylate cyclase [Ignavibacteriales bacterium CG_4_9_14_3_um_filter_34_10]
MLDNFKPEIEKKFLVKELPIDINKFQNKEITQGYISEPSADITIRIRKYGDKYFKTLKKKGFESRLENEVEISRNSFEAEWYLTEGKRIRKFRYLIPYKNRTIELDIFKDQLDGLIIAEVEFNSLEDSKNFIPPAWFGIEVTTNPKFSNSNLAKFGFPA